MTLWRRVGYDAYGQPKVTDEPVEIRVRLETRQRQSTDKDGNTITIEGDLVLGEAIPVGSVVWPNPLEDLPFGTSLTGEDDLLETISYDEVPDIKGRFSMKKAAVMRFRGSMPRQVN